MKFGSFTYERILKSAAVNPSVRDEALVAAHERVLTLEAEIKVLCDGAGKDRAEIERLRGVIKEVPKEFHKLRLIGTDGCKDCETGRVSMYVASEGLCFRCSL